MKSGERPVCYDYPDNPRLGWPDSTVTNNEVELDDVGGDVNLIPDKQSPPDLAWLISRGQHFGAHGYCSSYNFPLGATPGTNDNKYGQDKYNFKKLMDDMDANTTIMSPNTELNINLDPLCGMVPYVQS